MTPRRARRRRWIAVVWSLGWALSLSLLVVLVVFWRRNEPMFDEAVEDIVIPGEDPPEIEFALQCASGEEERSRNDDGVVILVSRREATPGTYRIGLMNRSAHTFYFSERDHWPSCIAERLNGATRTWDYCGFYGCGFDLREELRRLPPGDVLYLKGVADPTTFESRQWIRFRLNLRREKYHFPGPFVVVSRPILAQAK
jgi:hypothetical protein